MIPDINKETILFQDKRIDILEEQVASLCGKVKALENQKNTKEESVPVVDWSLYSMWYSYIAYSEYDKEWVLYLTRPQFVKNIWIGSGETRVPKDYCPIFSGEAKDSLCRRPY